MKIFVTGATGFIGSHLIPKLTRSGYKVVALVRNPGDSSKVESCGASEVVVGDINKPDSIKDAINKCDVVIHLAAIRSNWMPKNQFFAVNAYSLSDLLLASTKVKHFIYISSVYVFGNLASIPADENTPLNAHDTYGVSKIKAERILRSSLAKTKTKFTILRPAIVYGPNDNSSGMVMKLITLIKTKKLPVIGDGENMLHLIYIDDLTDGIVKAAGHNAANETYILAGPETISLKNMIGMVSKYLGLSFSPKYFPRLPIYLISYLVEFIFGLGLRVNPQFFSTEPPLLPVKVEVLSNNWQYDISKARKMLGFKPRVGYKEGIAKTVKWYLQSEQN